MIQNKKLIFGFALVVSVLIISTMALAGTPSSGEAASRNELAPMGTMVAEFIKSTGLFGYLYPASGKWTEGIGSGLMVGVGLLMLFLAIGKQFEPLLLVPMGFGCILANIPLAGITEPGGIIYYIYEIGIKTGAFPLLVFMGVGAMTDFGPMIANPKTALLGAAAQFGIFSTLIGALVLTEIVPGINFDLFDAASIGIIGGADGPTAIFLASQLSPDLLGAIAVAAYSYMALVPIIQPPIMRALTSSDERKIRMTQLRYVGKVEKIVFPFIPLGLCMLFLPSAAPLIGFFMFGNLMRECGVVERLSKTTQNALINIVTIFLGLGVGSRLSAGNFLSVETLGILLLGIIAFSIGTASGILMAKLMNQFSSNKINPLIGSAGVSAVPMAARVSQKMGMEEDPENMLLMFAMGPNVAGVIGSAVAAGVLLTLKNLVV
ncbi:sodium ion-translocating decarboxylase subunit beta [uncultured Desulfosarcina sp.]|uniref:sodium ion-translocating decarboxylase subunit beta n=1 Tax=uncultured Desulfosarcina sp. TaxID=218289 RepID=UPI0029C664C4|nr:sodium ion-translocating decarboxylase subunit beta [uncultured Desulfosarcina sp.]